MLRHVQPGWAHGRVAFTVVPAEARKPAMSGQGSDLGTIVVDRQTGWVERMPSRWRDLAVLARWDRPIGTWLLLLPCWWGLALGSGVHWGNMLGWMALFAIGALAARGAGCTWNDIVDRKIDARVERTRARPLPAGEVKLRDAVIWMALQSLVGVAILFKLNKTAGG